MEKVPALRGRNNNVFYEASTRTSSSLDSAAKRLSADVVSIRSVGSSVDKGESLKDTVQTLSAYDPAAFIIRSPHAGAAQLVSGWTPASVVDASNGKHEHPTQALLDVFTLRRRLDSLDDANIWIVGDVLHSRVAPLSVLAFTRMGARSDGVRAADPDPAPGSRRSAAAQLRRSTRVERADVIYVLRMQHERMQDAYVPSLREYAARCPLRLAPAATRGRWSCTPGPVNRGIRTLGHHDGFAPGADPRAGQGRRRRCG